MKFKNFRINEYHLLGTAAILLFTAYLMYSSTGYAGERTRNPLPAPGSDFSGIQLDGKRLIDTNFQGSSFRRASLRLADFSRADLRGTDLRSARLEGANLSHAKVNDQTQFQGARFDVYTLLPKSWGEHESERVDVAISRGMELVSPPFARYRSGGFMRLIRQRILLKQAQTEENGLIVSLQ